MGDGFGKVKVMAWFSAPDCTGPYWTLILVRELILSKPFCILYQMGFNMGIEIGT